MDQVNVPYGQQWPLMPPRNQQVGDKAAVPKLFAMASKGAVTNSQGTTILNCARLGEWSKIALRCTGQHSWADMC